LTQLVTHVGRLHDALSLEQNPELMSATAGP
jgi:hypothetical protein